MCVYSMNNYFFFLHETKRPYFISENIEIGNMKRERHRGENVNGVCWKEIWLYSDATQNKHFIVELKMNYYYN